MCPLPEQNDPFALEYFATVASGIRETLEKVGARLRLQTLPAGAAELPGAIFLFFFFFFFCYFYFYG